MKLVQIFLGKRFQSWSNNFARATPSNKLVSLFYINLSFIYWYLSYLAWKSTMMGTVDFKTLSWKSSWSWTLNDCFSVREVQIDLWKPLAICLIWVTRNILTTHSSDYGLTSINLWRPFFLLFLLGQPTLPLLKKFFQGLETDWNKTFLALIILDWLSVSKLD